VSCHHNYVAEEMHFGEELLITRKGAIKAGLGQLGIIPGSMGTKSFIVRGLGNPLSFESASHGAGRRMSRTQAKQSFGVSDLERQTEGVECRKDRGVVDEAPKAYKNIEQVIADMVDAGLISVIATLRPGTRIQVVGRTGEYFRVRSLDNEAIRGYVHKEDAFFEPYH